MTTVWLVVLPLLGVCAAIVVRRHRRMARGMREFHASPLRSMLAAGATTGDSVRLWGFCVDTGQAPLKLSLMNDAGAVDSCELPAPAPGAGGTFAIQYPQDVPGASALLANHAYHARWATSNGTVLGTCSFVTAPRSAHEAPQRFAIAAMSCNQPFDDYGFVSDRAKRLLGILPDELEGFGVKRVLLMGDQMYGDLPKYCSLTHPGYFQQVAPARRATLLECTRDEVRALYRERHRLFWKLPGFREVQTRFACHPILDDHEIIDNFGSSPRHASAEFAALRDGAIDAFYDFQAQRVLPTQSGKRPSAFYHKFEYGTAGVFVMDLRSERKVDDGRIVAYSEQQLACLEQFLRESGEKHVVIVVLSVPILHVPDWLADSALSFASSDGDVADRWANPKARAARDRLLRVLREHQKAHQKQRLVLVGGDIHVGVVGRLVWGDGIRDSYQLVSSAVSNASEFDMRRIVEALPKLKPVVGHGDAAFEGHLLPAGEAGESEAHGSNPYGRLNCGVIEVERIDEHESTVRLLLIGCSEGEPAGANIAFDSGRL